MSVIKVSNANKEFRSNSETNKVLCNFNMKVMKGAIYAIMGSSGCGKTTLISSLVGVISLDRGLIEIFGGSPSRNYKARIGYMPQDTALIPEFTIREMIWFFGTIFGMSTKKIDERLRFLTELLELPNRDKLIRECSGGQQRRVSFALTLIHEPELLILDEPTVGVDPLLRSKIWDYLVDITRTKNVTVLLTTHYIEEARHSTHIGIMRNGEQIAEDSPENILRTTGTMNLEEAYWLLSEKQEGRHHKQKDFEASPNSHESFRHKESSDSMEFIQPTKKRPVNNNQVSNYKILLALLTKNIWHVLRNSDVLFITTLMPLVGCICLNYAIGGRIGGLTLGVVDYEIASFDDCLNQTATEVRREGLDCLVRKASCRFINEFDDDVASKKFFKTSKEAFHAAKAGKIFGYIQFAKNFTKSTPILNRNNFIMNDFSDDGIIQVFLDQTDLQKTLLMRRKLYEAYQKFLQNFLKSCGKSQKVGYQPIVFEAAFGDINYDLRGTIVPGFILAGYFALASYVTSVTLIDERLNGIWSRTLVAGAEPVHFLLSHLIEGLFITTIQFAEYSIFVIFVFSSQVLSWDAALLLSFLLFLTGAAGLLFGLLLSIVMSTSLGSFFLAQFFVYPATFLSGAMWPIEGIPFLLQIVGYALPFALPVAAFRSIFFKASRISEPVVFSAFILLSVWIVVELLLCFCLINKKK